MYRNILIPVIFDEEHDTNASYLAARALADKDAVFTVLHVLEAIPRHVSAEISQGLLDNARREVEKKLVESARALPGAKTKLIAGHAGRSVVDFATEMNADCIVVASHRPGFEDYFLGSTAARVVRHANCSVHVIR